MNQFELSIDQRLEIGTALCQRIVGLEELVEKYDDSKSMKGYVSHNREVITGCISSLNALDLGHMLPIYKRNMKGGV